MAMTMPETFGYSDDWLLNPLTSKAFSGSPITEIRLERSAGTDTTFVYVYLGALCYVVVEATDEELSALSYALSHKGVVEFASVLSNCGKTALGVTGGGCSEDYVLMVGGSLSGTLLFANSSLEVLEVPAPTVPNHSNPLAGISKIETELYHKEVFEIHVKKRGVLFGALCYAFVHESIPSDVRSDMFQGYFKEFPFVRITPMYYKYWQLLREFGFNTVDF